MFEFVGLYILPLIIALAIHEFSHALAAELLGDPTARLKGRLTLNPIAHLDPFGSLFFLITAVSSFVAGMPFVFGWGKPVPVDPYNLEHPKRDMGIVAAAGPGSNLVTALVIAIVIKLLWIFGVINPSDTLWMAFGSLISISVGLAAFNVIPVHPLDGGKILVALLPDKYAEMVNSFLYRYGTILLIFLIVTGATQYLIVPIATGFLAPIYMILNA